MRHRIKQNDFSGLLKDRERYREMLASGPIDVVDGEGKVRFYVSNGHYPKPDECPWCEDSIELCEILDHCGGVRLRKIKVRTDELAGAYERGEHVERDDLWRNILAIAELVS